MGIKAPNNYCDGCVWAKVELRGKLVYCPFTRCVRQTLAAVENNSVAKSEHANKTS